MKHFQQLEPDGILGGVGGRGIQRLVCTYSICNPVCSSQYLKSQDLPKFKWEGGLSVPPTHSWLCGVVFMTPDCLDRKTNPNYSNFKFKIGKTKIIKHFY